MIHIEQGEFAEAIASFSNNGLIVERSGGSSMREIVPWPEILAIRVIKILPSSSTRGTMDYGMTNPTFILPTTLILNIISHFQKRKDLVTFEAQLSGNRSFTATCQRSLVTKIEKRIQRNR